MNDERTSQRETDAAMKRALAETTIRVLRVTATRAGSEVNSGE